MIKLKIGGTDAFRAVLARVASVVQLVRPVDRPVPPPYTRCTGCGKGGRDDQQVPDPDQFTKVKTADGSGTPGTEKAEGDVKLIDAAPVWCWHCGSWFHAIGCYSTHRGD